MIPNSLTSHLQNDRFGDFRLTQAIRPGLKQAVTPREGFRIDTYRDEGARFQVPVLAASVSRESLFEVFLELMEPLGSEVDVVLETSHQIRRAGHRDLLRENIDLPVWQSYCCEFEDLLVDDGCTGVAVISNQEPIELQFDEHKLLIVYASDLSPFREVLDGWGVERDDAMKLITEGEHLHSTDPSFAEAFNQLSLRLGVGAPGRHVNW